MSITITKEILDTLEKALGIEVKDGILVSISSSCWSIADHDKNRLWSAAKDANGIITVSEMELRATEDDF